MTKGVVMPGADDAEGMRREHDGRGHAGHPVRVLVVMPTYNEVENLNPTLTELLERNPRVDVLIVDDDSPDGTGRLADFMVQGDRRLHVLHRPGKQGLGPAYVQGFRWALARGYDVICEMDMDGSHRAEDLRRMLDVLARRPEVDLVIGSRRVPGGTTVNWPWPREMISRIGSWYARTMLGLRVRDVTAGLRAYRADCLHRLDLKGIEAGGYVFQVDMTRRVAAAGGMILEVPIVFIERIRGASKMSLGIIFEAMWRVTLWGFGRHLPHSRI